MFDEGLKWIESCVADGWDELQVYPGSASESIRLTKEGFTLSVYDHHSVGGGDVAAWGPDKLAIELPNEYDWEAIQAAVTHCSECDYIGKTMRLGFAKRVCRECRTKLLDKYEYAGWCN